MGKETELKLEVGDLQLLDCILTCPEIRRRQQTAFSYVKMEITYFDTADGALAEKRWMLRLRKENERTVITLKTDGAGHSRGEWETEAELLADGLQKLLALGAPEEVKTLSDRELLPLCGAQYTRILTNLFLDDGTKCELCGDVGEVFANGKRAPLCELELELKEGSEEELLAFGKTLMQTYRVREGTKSKYARARALLET